MVTALFRTCRDVQELFAERGTSVYHVTLWRWVQRYTPESENVLGMIREDQAFGRSSAGEAAPLYAFILCSSAFKADSYS